MKVMICSLASSLHAETMMPASQERFIRELREALAGVSPDLELVFEDDDGVMAGLTGHLNADDQIAPTAALMLIYVWTGGTEGAFKAALTAPNGTLRLPRRPVRLLTSGKSNSLAASMEILSFLRLHGCAGEILHGSPDYVAGRIAALAASSSDGSASDLHENGGNMQKGDDNGPNLNENVENVQAEGDGTRADAEPCLGRRPFCAAVWRPLLAGKRLGIVGRPSDWLISSDVDPVVAQQELGLELVDIPMSELIAEIRKGGCELPDDIHWPSVTACPDAGRWPVEPAMTTSPALASSSSPASASSSSPARPGISSGPITRPFQPRFGRTLTPDVFNGAMDIFGALCRLIARYRLDGLTLRCFDLLTEVGNTGCMALAILNAQGIPSSCEGDVPALISMLIGRVLTGCCGFQANPARIDPQTGEMLLAHCTVPLDMIRCGEYDTHFESGIGVAVRGELPEGPVTIFKVSPDLRQCFAADAELVRNQAERDLCRTQVVLSAPGTARYFLTDSIGNHHIILPGHHADQLMMSQ